MKRRTLLLTAGLVAAPSIVSAQAFPANPVRLIHGYDAGSNPDTIARHLSQPLTEIMGVQIVIEPKPGAAERVAATQVARMKPDGNVLYLMLPLIVPDNVLVDTVGALYRAVKANGSL